MNGQIKSSSGMDLVLIHSWETSLLKGINIIHCKDVYFNLIKTFCCLGAFILSNEIT